MTAKATAAAFGDSRSGSPRARPDELRSASPAPGAPLDSIAAGSDIKVGHALEFVKAGLNVLRRQPQQPPQAEFLDRETRHHGAVNQRPPEPPVGEVAAAREISHEAARKAVSGADRKSTRLNSSHLVISYAVFCLKKKKKNHGANCLRHARVCGRSANDCRVERCR